eukprot:1409093-Pleurochrysis_carterae.AAC.1
MSILTLRGVAASGVRRYFAEWPKRTAPIERGFVQVARQDGSSCRQEFAHSSTKIQSLLQGCCERAHFAGGGVQNVGADGVGAAGASAK